jgi:hypothetical protein
MSLVAHANSGLVIHDTYYVSPSASPRETEDLKRFSARASDGLGTSSGLGSASAHGTASGSGLPPLIVGEQSSPSAGNGNRSSSTVDGYRFSVVRRTHLKLCSKMKVDANCNKWMLIDTAVDMMTHAHVNTEPATGRRRSGSKSDSNEDLPQSLSVSSPNQGKMPMSPAPAASNGAANSSPEAGQSVPVSTRTKPLNSVRFAVDMPGSNGSGGIAATQLPITDLRKSARDTSGISYSSRTTADDEVSDCSSAIAQCLLDWMDCRADVIFSEHTLLAIHKCWCTVVKGPMGTAASNGSNGTSRSARGGVGGVNAVGGSEELALSLSSKYNLSDANTNNIIAAADLGAGGPVVTAADDRQLSNATAQSSFDLQTASTDNTVSVQNGKMNEGKVTFADSIINSIIGVSPLRPQQQQPSESLAAAPTSSTSSALVPSGVGGEETIQSFIEKELAVIASAADITSELDKAFVMIESTSSKRHDVPGSKRDNTSDTKPDKSSVRMPTKEKQPAAGLSKNNSAAMAPSASLGGLFVNGSELNKNGATGVDDWDQLNLYNGVFATVELQLDR